MKKNSRKLHEDLPLGDYPDRPSVNEMSSKFYTDTHDICDGQVTILRTKQSGQVWQMRCWISAEKKHFKKSLRTKNLEDAKDKARKQYYSMMGKVEAGMRVFSITAGDLVEKYLEHQQARADGGMISQRRIGTIRTYLKHFLEFVGKGRMMDTINKEKYKDYYLFRRKKHKDVKDVTLLNERATIGNLNKWGLEQGFITQNKLPVWAELRKSNIGSRTAFNIRDYQTLYGYLNQYTKNIDDEKELYRRKIIRDFILISSNTGLRFGECRLLKWHNIEIVKGKNKYPNVHIRVPAEISKVKRDRTAVGMRGDLFKRIKSYSMDTHPSDYIFTDWQTGKPLGRKVMYNLWDTIMKGSGLDQSHNNYSYYCLRHTFATYRLQYGKIDIRTLAKVMGCSVNYIEKHYDSAIVEDMTDYITRGINEKSKDAFNDIVLR